LKKLKWDAPLDPVELKDYVIDWSAEMTATSDTIATALFELPAEAVADGLSIDHQTNTTTDMTVWLEVPNAGDRAAIVGKSYLIEATITTAAGRTLNVSSKLSVVNK
jgi:hypothetical protein